MLGVERCWLLEQHGLQMKGNWEMSLRPQYTTLVCDLGQVTYSFGTQVSFSGTGANNSASLSGYYKDYIINVSKVLRTALAG